MIKVTGDDSPIQVKGFLEGIIDLFAGLEDYKSPYAPTVQQPSELIEQLVQNAALKTGLVSATCSLPPGPLGLLSLRRDPRKGSLRDS